MPLRSKLAELTGLPGPSGAEGPVADYVHKALADQDISAETDSIGNVVVRPSANPDVLVTAHMDQVGFMVSRIESDHAVCLPVGNIDLAGLGQTRVRVLAGSGTVDMTLSGTGPAGTARLFGGPVTEIAVGDRVIYAPGLEDAPDGTVRGPALDNRVGCLILLKTVTALRDDAMNIAFAWTVREEGEYAGALAAARALSPRHLVSVDVTYATNAEEVSQSDVVIGGGPAITLLDGGMVGFAPLIQTFDDAAESLGMAWQREVVGGGVSEAGRVQSTLGVPGLALLVPMESEHSPHERASLDDIERTVALLVAGLRRLVS